MKAGDALVRHLRRLKVEQMTEGELDAACALRLGHDPRLDESSDRVEVQDGVEWRPFSPTRDWNDYGRLVTSLEVVVGSHTLYDDDNAPSGCWFSAHCYSGGTRFESARSDLRVVVGRSMAAQLLIDLGRQDT